MKLENSSSSNEENQRSRKRKELDSMVLDAINTHPGYTLKQLQSLLTSGKRGEEFGISFITNSLVRLRNEEKIYSQTQDNIIHGKVINTYYTYDSRINTNNEYELRFKKEHFKKIIKYTNNQKILAYSIDRNKIAIATSENSFYKNHSKFSEELVTIEDEQWVSFSFLKEFKEFYELEEGKYSFKIEPNLEKEAFVLIRIANKISSIEKQITIKKKILIFEDDVDWADELIERLENEGHNVKFATNVEDFKKRLDEFSPFDFISLDKQIIDEERDVAGELFFEIKKKSPNAKIGLLSRTIAPSEFDYYKKLGFTCLLLKKRRDQNRSGFKEVGEELIATLRVI